MKYNVTIGEKTYTVEIEDINQRPVIARVDGEAFQVFIERRAAEPSSPGKDSASITAKPVSVASLPLSKVENAGNALLSPLPGTVVEIFVKPGEQVEAGQVALIIEAMKMKNSIRLVRGGVIKRVLVNAGQTVAHRQPLVEFEP
ncbi:MAG: acetyl-CoA carboxylase biotin carboxyl carrier protein subunit [Anaerolineae bacterium]|nr:MAG: acetyl-CoA carboxylase biotin carboxyl carrier protein subunit [Anaerolineae bacterium]